MMISKQALFAKRIANKSANGRLSLKMPVEASKSRAVLILLAMRASFPLKRLVP